MTALDPLLPANARPIDNQPDLAQPPPSARQEPPTSLPPRTNGTAKQQPAHRPPPHDLDAERALLGAAMLGNPEPLELVPDGAFYLTAHGHLASTIRALAGEGAPIDPVTVADHLAERGLLPQVGDVPAIGRILADTPTARGATRYAEIVLRHHQARRLLHLAEQVDTTTRDHGPAAAITHLRSQLAELDQPVGEQLTVPTLAEFVDTDEDDHDWIVPGLLENTDRLLLTGPEGGGKSTLLRQMAVQIAAGIHPFTLEPIEPLPVLLLDLENSARHIRRQIRPLRIAAHHQADDLLHVESRPAGLDLTDPHDANLLEQLVAVTGARIVLGGPVYKLVGGDPTEEQPARGAAQLIDRLRARYQTTWLLETHQPHENGGKRPDRPYGASLWKRWPEFGLHLTDTGQVRHWRGDRDQRSWPAALIRGGDWPWTLAPPKDANFARLVEAVRDHGGPLSIRELEHKTGISRSQIDRMLKANKTHWDALNSEYTT